MRYLYILAVLLMMALPSQAQVLKGGVEKTDNPYLLPQEAILSESDKLPPAFAGTWSHSRVQFVKPTLNDKWFDENCSFTVGEDGSIPMQFTRYRKNETIRELITSRSVKQRTLHGIIFDVQGERIVLDQSNRVKEQRHFWGNEFWAYVFAGEWTPLQPWSTPPNDRAWVMRRFTWDYQPVLRAPFQYASDEIDLQS